MLLILTQTPVESLSFYPSITIQKEKHYPNTAIYECLYENFAFLITYTGYGKLNCGISLGLTYANHPITSIIGIGDCAYIGPDYANTGTVAVSESSLELDVDFTPLGYRGNTIPNLTYCTYRSDHRLIKLAKTACQTMKMHYESGSFLSADSFVANKDYAKKLRMTYLGSFIDNECGPVGQFCFESHVPYVFIKGISNYADDNAVKMHQENEAIAREAAEMVVVEMLEILGKSVQEDEA